MRARHSRVDQTTRQLRDRLKTTGVGLGLLRLQLDAGMTEEARTTLSSLQNDFQLLLHGVKETEKRLVNSHVGPTGDRWRSSDATSRGIRKSQPTPLAVVKGCNPSSVVRRDRHLLGS
jgi:hypothetical protein